MGANNFTEGGDPALYAYQDMVYVADYTNASNYFAPQHPGNFSVTGISSANGNVVFTTYVEPTSLMNTSENLSFGYSIVFLGGKMSISYLLQGSNGTTVFNSTLYELGSTGISEASSSSVPVPYDGVWGVPGSEWIQAYGQFIEYNIHSDNRVIIQNMATSQLKAFNATGMLIGITGNSFYMVSRASSSAQFYAVNISTGQKDLLFNMTDSNLNSTAYEYTARLLPSGIILYYSQSDFTGIYQGSGTPPEQNGIKLEAFNEEGVMLWKMTPFKPTCLYNEVSIRDAGGGNILLVSQPHFIFTTETSFQANFVTINATSGDIVSNETYSYSTSFLSPPPFHGIYGYDNGMILYNIGDTLAAAKE